MARTSELRSQLRQGRTDHRRYPGRLIDLIGKGAVDLKPSAFTHPRRSGRKCWNMGFQEDITEKSCRIPGR